MKKILFALICLFSLTGIAQEISLIPQPAVMKVNDGKFLFNGKVVVCYPKIKESGIDAVVENFVKEMNTTTGVKVVKNRLKNGKMLALEHIKTKHLAILREADLIRDAREGKYIFYELNTSVLEEIMLWITDLKGDGDNV